MLASNAIYDSAWYSTPQYRERFDKTILKPLVKVSFSRFQTSLILNPLNKLLSKFDEKRMIIEAVFLVVHAKQMALQCVFTKPSVEHFEAYYPDLDFVEQSHERESLREFVGWIRLAYQVYDRHDNQDFFLGIIPCLSEGKRGTTTDGKRRVSYKTGGCLSKETLCRIIIVHCEDRKGKTPELSATCVKHLKKARAAYLQRHEAEVILAPWMQHSARSENSCPGKKRKRSTFNEVVNTFGSTSCDSTSGSEEDGSAHVVASLSTSRSESCDSPLHITKSNSFGSSHDQAKEVKPRESTPSKRTRQDDEGVMLLLSMVEKASPGSATLHKTPAKRVGPSKLSPLSRSTSLASPSKPSKPLPLSRSSSHAGNRSAFAESQTFRSLSGDIKCMTSTDLAEQSAEQSIIIPSFDTNVASRRDSYSSLTSQTTASSMTTTDTASPFIIEMDAIDAKAGGPGGQRGPLGGGGQQAVASPSNAMHEYAMGYSPSPVNRSYICMSPVPVEKWKLDFDAYSHVTPVRGKTSSPYMIVPYQLDPRMIPMFAGQHLSPKK